ncbi:helix-turn-helix transcriptional regulator [Inquilinus sp. OTU3971]|uniref:helix-turn-helix transcriptional regulator n=1 Tax=Inquilinus sp. OTU3971 TaxID=3043855 RepID=UPI00313E4CE4
MDSTETGITRKGKAGDIPLLEAIVDLYAAEPDLLTLPQLLFASVLPLIDADAVTFSEFHHRSGEFRTLASIEDEPARRVRAAEAYRRHMHSHPFWQHDPDFFGEWALRESDFFTDAEYHALPIAQEAFLPSGSHRVMAIVMRHDDYVLAVTGHRSVNRPAYSDLERDRLQAFRPHALRAYRQAQGRTLAKLTPAGRLRLAYPELTQRQLEVASWIAQGKSNEDIATILGVGIDTIKAHAKAVHGKIGSEGRRAAAVIAHTVPPFAQLPPLWTLDVDAWGGPRRA